MAYIYIIEFDGGLIKVGRSINPQQRISSHRSNVLNLANKKIIREWISADHSCDSENELKLINYCASQGECSGGREWFYGVCFDDAVLFANGLDFSVHKKEPKIFNFAALDSLYDQEKQRAMVSDAYEYAIKLQSFILNSLWVGGDIFKPDDVTGLSPFVVVMAAYFCIGDPIEKLIDSVSEISIYPENEIYAVNKLFNDALACVKAETQ